MPAQSTRIGWFARAAVNDFLRGPPRRLWLTMLTLGHVLPNFRMSNRMKHHSNGCSCSNMQCRASGQASSPNKSTWNDSCAVVRAPKLDQRRRAMCDFYDECAEAAEFDRAAPEPPSLIRTQTGILPAGWLAERARWARLMLEIPKACWLAMCASVDISVALFASFDARCRAGNRLRDSEMRIRSVFNNLPNCVVFQLETKRNGERSILHISETAEQIHGIPASSIMRDPTALFEQVHPEDLTLLLNSERDSAEHMTAFEITIRMRRPDGTTRWINLCATPRNATGGRIIWDGVEIDITERKNANDEIQRLGFYDILTGLPNRRLLFDRLAQAIAVSGHSQRLGAMFFVDIDNFKDLNDTLGHDFGDKLLQKVAGRLKRCLRECDTVARSGGDEFAVVLQDLSEDTLEAAAQAMDIGTKLLASMSQPIIIEGKRHFISLSLGITLFGDQNQVIGEVHRNADLALYEAKAAGRNTLRFFDPKMHVTVTARAAMENDLRRALAGKEFVLFYQPQVDGENGLVGVEALIRWQHPERGIVSPIEFISLAETTGLILPLGAWVLDTACKQLYAWSKRENTAHLTIAVNVSVRQFKQADFVEQVLEVLERTGADPARLKLELTESLFADNIEDLIDKMSKLMSHGVGFSLDDFGTGYSSLVYLKRLPLQQLKIDRSFVREVLTNPNDAAIAKMIIALSKTMGLSVIAEGVETDAQRQFLAAHGCHAYQGYLIAPPLPIAKLESAMRLRPEKRERLLARA